MLAGMFIACEDLKFGNDFLEKPISDDVLIDSVFSTKRYADQALRQFYKSLPDYNPSSLGYHYESQILDCYSDLGYTVRCSWRNGALTASGASGSAFPYHLTASDVQGDPSFGIRKAYIYLENVDRVKDMTEEEKTLRKAEAKVVIAYHYSDLIRYYGGVPWIERAYDPGETFHFERMTLEESVKKTVDLLDEAAGDLPWYTTDEEYGHMTAAVAKAIKFRLLLFVASPIFNNDTPYLDGEAAQKRLSWYGDYQQKRWQDAYDAGKEFLLLNKANEDYYRVEDTDNPRADFINGYFTKGNKECIMPSFRWAVYAKGNKAWRMDYQGYHMPRSNYADMFRMLDGSEFDWENETHRANPFFDAEGKPVRDIRLYETLVVNGDKWSGKEKVESYVGGKHEPGGSDRGQSNELGYAYRKFFRNRGNEMDKQRYSCPLIRMPEIWLGMAEARNQLGLATTKDSDLGMDAYDMLNIVHMRAGFTTPVTSATVNAGNDLLDYLLSERACEFGQEDQRYHDMRRHLKGEEWATRPVEKLRIYQTGVKNVYTYEVTEDNAGYMWDDSWYLIPFPTEEMNKKYGLIQNPGW